MLSVALAALPRLVMNQQVVGFIVLHGLISHWQYSFYGAPKNKKDHVVHTSAPTVGLGLTAGPMARKGTLKQMASGWPIGFFCALRQFHGLTAELASC